MQKIANTMIMCAVFLLTANVESFAEETGLLFKNSDFELGTLENWRLEEEAFNNQPTKGDNVRARVKSRRAMPQGLFWASSYENYQGKPGQKPGQKSSDKAMGGLISEPFIIEKSIISFLVAGGRGDDLQVQLIVQGQVVRKTTGGLSPFFRRAFWDVTEFLNEKGQIYIFDRSSDVWGQIAVDDFRYLDAAPNLELFPNSDFEMGELGNWSAEGDAFEDQPVKGDNLAARTQGTRKAGQDGEFWIGTYESFTGAEGQKPGDARKDAPKGTLTSMPFEIKGEGITFNIAGGETQKTEVQLLVDGKVVLRASGANDSVLVPVVWDLEKFKNRTAEIKIVDDSEEEWGFISCDSFRYTRLPSARSTSGSGATSISNVIPQFRQVNYPVISDGKSSALK